MSEDISLAVTRDEALVLCEFFRRFEETSALVLSNNAEFIALSRISAQLDRQLVEPLQKNFSQLVAAAQERLSKGYEGLAPSVIASEA